MRTFRTKIDSRRQTFLVLIAEIERQLREAYDRKFRAGEATQSSLASKLGINRSVVHRRLTGRSNMTVETIADMVWALDQTISIKISDVMADDGSNWRQETTPHQVVPSAGNLPGVTTMSSLNIPAVSRAFQPQIA
jgi:hypothetical protein